MAQEKKAPSPAQPHTYFDWHFVTLPQQIFSFTLNLVIFFYHYFSVGLLLKTLLAPWKRQIVTQRSPGFSLTELFEVITFNLISRAIGALVRTFLILTWLIFEIVIIPFGLLALITWIILPGFTLPFYLLFKKKKDPAKSLLAEKPLDPSKILLGLTKTPLGKFVFPRLHLDASTLGSISVSDQEKEKFRSQFEKYLQSQKTDLEKITSQDLLLLLAEKLPPFKKFLDDKKIKPSDLDAVSHWYQRILDRWHEGTDILKLETLLRIPPFGKNLAFGYTPNLDRYCLEITRPLPYAHQLVGRKRETAQIEQVLSRQTGNSVLLVGEPGVGRTTIVEAFAKKVREGRVNRTLAHKRILNLGLRRLLAETKSTQGAKGLVEEILEEAALAGNIIIVIENFGQYVSTGSGRLDLTNVFTKAAAKGLQMIGITTFDDFAKYFYPNQELLKFFEKVEASPPTNQEARVILEDTVALYEKRNNVFFTFQALEEIIDKVDKYVTHIPFPEKAIDLLDEAAVFAAQKNLYLITPKQINLVISEKTKIPLGELGKEETEKLKNLEEVIHERIINQEEAVVAIARAMRRARVGISKGNKPIGGFLFMGPTGVGKTETAKALAEAYFGSEERLIRFDMSEYQGKEAIERVIGSTRTNEPGVFVKRIRENPFSLLLLDEIEKTHPNILNLFLTMLDEGYFTDAFGKKVDCRSLIIIGTSNAGTELIRQRINQGAKPDQLEKEVVDHVQKEGIFSPEFINRFDAVVIYRPLTHENLLKVAELMLKNLNQRLKKKEIWVKITPKLLEKIVELGYEPAFGARPMNRVIQDKVEDQIAQKLLQGKLKKGEIEVEI